MPLESGTLLMLVSALFLRTMQRPTSISVRNLQSTPLRLETCPRKAFRCETRSKDPMALKSTLVSLLLVYFRCCCALYFHIAETERKCFIEEIPDETLVVGKYKIELHDPQTRGYMQTSPAFGMHVEVRDPEDKTILSKVYSAEGKFSFTSHTPGEHVICLYSNSTRWFAGAQLRVHLDIQVGEHAIDYANVAQKEKLSELQLRVRQLLDQVEQISKEQNYQRYREERFRQTSESTNSRVLWWSFGQTLILLAMGFWQMRHLKSFFEAKKLV